MRVILVISLCAFVSVAAQAMGVNGIGVSSNCIYTGKETVGSCISYGNQGSLSTTDGSTWHFTGEKTLHVSGPPVNLRATQAIFCQLGSYDQSSVSWQDSNAAVGSNYYPWWTYAGYEVTAQQSHPCANSSPYFLRNGRGGYYSFSKLCSSAATGDELEVKAQPSGIPFWMQFCTIMAKKVSLKLASGSVIGHTPGCNNGVGIICIGGAGDILIGGGVVLEDIDNQHKQCDSSSGVRILPNAFSSVIEGANTSGRLVIQHVNEGILSAYGDGLVTLKHVEVADAGAEGLCHSVYLSNGHPPSPFKTGGWNDGEAINDLIVRNPTDAGPAMKLDYQCLNTECHDTHIQIYCSVENSSVCGMNWTLDQQCGGNRLVDYSIFEDYGDGIENGNGFQWTLMKANQGGSGCPANRPSTNNTMRIDHSVFIVDGQAAGAGPQGVMVMCVGNYSGGNKCGADGGNATVCITNSQLVYDSAKISVVNMGPPGVASPVLLNSTCTGVTPDTNTYYAGRTAVCAASNWKSGSGTRCAFPFVPQYLAKKETHDTLVAEARSAGLCGAGTINDPIRLCESGRETLLQ